MAKPASLVPDAAHISSTPSKRLRCAARTGRSLFRIFLFITLAAEHTSIYEHGAEREATPTRSRLSMGSFTVLSPAALFTDCVIRRRVLRCEAKPRCGRCLYLRRPGTHSPACRDRASNIRPLESRE